MDHIRPYLGGIWNKMIRRKHLITIINFLFSRLLEYMYVNSQSSVFNIFNLEKPSTCRDMTDP